MCLFKEARIGATFCYDHYRAKFDGEYLLMQKISETEGRVIARGHRTHNIVLTISPNNEITLISA